MKYLLKLGKTNPSNINNKNNNDKSVNKKIENGKSVNSNINCTNTINRLNVRLKQCTCSSTKYGYSVSCEHAGMLNANTNANKNVCNIQYKISLIFEHVTKNKRISINSTKASVIKTVQFELADITNTDNH